MAQPTTLPIIDISPFLLPCNPAARQATATSIHNAIIQFGFLYITGVESVVSDLEEPLGVAREFFGRPAEEKAKLRIRAGDGARGYQLLGENVTSYKADHHEALDFYCPVTPEDPTVLMGGPNQWPSQPPHFRSVMESWVSKMKVLGMALMEATAMGLGMDLEGEEWKGLRENVENSFWVMRTIGYPPLPQDAPGVSCGAHKDYGLWTLLLADETRGALQVFLHDTAGECEERGQRGTWISADPMPNAFVVNIGEMWETWTNGLYRATLHRVMYKGDSYRVSIPFFFEPARDALVSPLPSALRLQELATGKPTDPSTLKSSIRYGDFLASKVSGNFALVDAA